MIPRGLLGYTTVGETMAKFQPILGNIAGSIGGNTFSNNRGGSYIRRRSKPTNPNSQYQQTVRAHLSTLTKSWQYLTATLREQWDTWADGHSTTDPLGNDRHYTGHQMYIALNLRRLLMGLPPNPAPPTDDTPPSLTTLVAGGFDLVANTVEFIFTPSPLGTDYRIQAWQCRPYAGNRNPNFKQAYLMGFSPAAAGSPQTFPLRFPLQPGDSVVFYAAVVSASGLQSPPLRFKVDSVPTPGP